MQQERANTSQFENVSRMILRAGQEDMQRLIPALTAAIPELAPLVGFDQRSPHHAYDLYTHVAYVVGGVPEEPALRWAALLHDVGKIPTFTRDETGRGHFYGHAPEGAKIAGDVLQRLQAPRELTRRVVFLIKNHMTKLPLEKDALAAVVNELGMEPVEQLVALQEADMRSKGVPVEKELVQFVLLRQLLKEIGHAGI